jgi:RNA polymerase sigma-70 factor (ECF subfamily)
VNENSDINVFHKIKEGNFDAFNLLFEQYYTPLCNYASGYFRDDFTCEDIVQEVFVKIWGNRQKIRISGSLKSYLYTAVKNASLNKLKSESIRQSYISAYSENEEHLAEADEIELQEFREYLARCIEKLPPRCKDVFIQSRFNDTKQEKIASDMEISVKTVKAQIGKALKYIRECLQTSYPEFF